MENDPTFSEAKQLYFEKYGDAIITNCLPRGITLALNLSDRAQILALNVRTLEAFRNWPTARHPRGRINPAAGGRLPPPRMPIRRSPRRSTSSRSVALTPQRFADRRRTRSIFQPARVEDDVIKKSTSRPTRWGDSSLMPAPRRLTSASSKVSPSEPIDEPLYRARVDFYRVGCEPARALRFRGRLYTRQTSSLPTSETASWRASPRCQPAGERVHFLPHGPGVHNAVNKGQTP